MSRRGRIENVSEETLIEIMKILIELHDNKIEIIGRSMEPTYIQGQVLEIQMSCEQFQEGDVITFINNNHLTTHRIVDIINEEGEMIYITKGDGNLHSQERVRKNLIIGKIKN